MRNASQCEERDVRRSDAESASDQYVREFMNKDGHGEA